MKILLVVHYFLPHVGGMEKVVEKQAKSLVAYGHEVTIVTARPEKDAPHFEERDGYKVVRVPAFNGVEQRFGVTFPLVWPWEIVRFLRLVKQHDIVHIHDVFYMTSHLAWLACMLRGKRFFLTQHVAMVDHPSRLVMAVQRLMYGTFGRAIFTRAQKIVSYNHIVRDFLLRYGVQERNILTQYNGINTMYFAPLKADKKQLLREKYRLPLDRPIVLFVGRLVPKKGYEFAYNAQSSDFFTLIVGDGVRPKRIISNDNVRLFGAANPQQLKELYALSDIFVFPAVGEIFTLVMQEAMASGLPVIMADDPGYTTYDFSRQHIRLVARDSDIIRREIVKILQNDKLKNTMTSYARNFAVDYFDWSKNYAREYALYEIGAGDS
jgi:D-inositol-3-phosphate glycosyltransferase